MSKNANIHAKEYQLYLPSKEELQKKLVEWAGEAEQRENALISLYSGEKIAAQIGIIAHVY